MLIDLVYKYLHEDGKTLDQGVIYEAEKIAGAVFKRQFMTDPEDKPGTIRLSGVGRCSRQQAYNFHGFEPAGKEMDGRAKLTFFIGDLVELAVISLVKIAVNKFQTGNVLATGLSQMTLKLDKISGHPDGIYYFYEDKKWRVIEVKSMADYSFGEFEKNGMLDSGYLGQVHAYMEWLGFDECIFIGLNKNNSILHEQVIKKDPLVVEIIRGNIKSILESTPDSLPVRPYQPNEKGFYPWQCLYCPHHITCLPEAEKILVGKAYKLKEKQSETKQTKTDRL